MGKLKKHQLGNIIILQVLFLIYQIQNQDLHGFPLVIYERISCVLVCEHTMEYIRHNKAIGKRFKLL